MKRFITLLVVLRAAVAHAETAVDCATQPSVAITTGSGNYKITGTCDKVAISGGNNKVAIEAAKNLAITGSNNLVTVDKADKIAALGSNNRVTYGGGLTVARPKVASAGSGNIIVAKAPPPTEDLPVDKTTKTGAITPMPGTQVDCSKTATKSITTNDGNYVFTGKCTLITIDGNNNRLKVDSAKSVAINGNKNSVDVTAVDKLATTGDENSVRWKKGVAGAKATVSNLGTSNTVAQTK